jgi:hypothetical protein
MTGGAQSGGTSMSTAETIGADVRIVVVATGVPGPVAGGDPGLIVGPMPEGKGRPRPLAW